MKVPIDKIKVTKRIRKEITKIDELAADIERNGLLNPITVMHSKNGEFQLLAGFRRLKAVEKLAWSEIDINVVSPTDAESAILIEINENEQREDFTFSEKMDFANILEEIEREKSKERMSLGGKGGINQKGKDGRPTLEIKQSRDAVGEKIDMSGRQYDRAKYIVENAPEEVIEELDKGERSISGTYEELRAKEKPKTSRKATKMEELFSKKDLIAIERNKQFHAMPPEEKVVELQRQLKEERIRATNAESELSMLKELHHNAVYHKDGIIENLQARLDIAETLLDEARARIKELEAT